MERLWNQGTGKSPRPTAASLAGGPQPALWLPPPAPDQPLCCVLARLQGCLCLSVGFPIRPGTWSSCLIPAECFQLGLGNWCQLLWGKWLALPVLLAGRLQSVAGAWPENQAFPRVPVGGLGSRAAGSWFLLVLWTKVQITQDSVSIGPQTLLPMFASQKRNNFNWLAGSWLFSLILQQRCFFSSW